MNTSLQVSSSQPSAIPSDYGDARAEFHALLSGCGIYDLKSQAKIRVTGNDRVRWLNGMVTNNIRDLAAGHGTYCFLLNAQGHIQADFYAFNLGESLMVDLDLSQREKVLQWFDHYIIADDVELSDVTGELSAVGLTGPNSRQILQTLGLLDNESSNLAYLQLTDLEWRGIRVTLLRLGEDVKESWQLWVAPDHSADLWKALTEAGGQPVGELALRWFRISRGIPKFGEDIRERDLPQETGQVRALNFTKGCYLGQEIVERIRSRGAVRRQFMAFLVDGTLPGPGTKIVAADVTSEKDGKEVGEITSSAELPLPAGRKAVALGYLRREAMGERLHAGEAALQPTTVPIS
jgi:folate-binding protein YgfZ